MGNHFTIKASAAFVLLVVLTMAAYSFDAYARELRVRIRDEYVFIPASQQRAVSVDGDVFIPLRAIAEAMGFSAEWDELTQTAGVSRQGYDSLVQIGSDNMHMNGRPVPLDISAQMMNGRTMVSMQTLAEIIGMDVIFHVNAQTVFILEPIRVIHDWPEHLPRHIPGSVILDPTLPLNQHWAAPPMRHRAAFYTVPLEIVRLFPISIWDESVGINYLHEDISIIMYLVQHFDISREDFDAAVARMTVTREQMAARGIINLASEGHEIPNADIIFTFDNDIIRYFYRRE